MLPKNVDDLYPLTPMQRLMLLHAIASSGNGVLLNQVCYDIRGELDAAAFRCGWESLVARHPALRTAFLWEGLPQPLQVVRTAVALPFRSVDLSALDPEGRERAVESLRREDAELPMTLGKAPLMRCTLVRLADGHHRFFWAIHHLVIDRWSHAVLFSDLRALYSAQRRSEAPRLPPSVPFRDYVAWLARQDRDAAERFWRGELAGLREPTLLADRAGARANGGRRTTRRPLSRELSAAVRDRAARWRTTPGGLLLSAVGLLLAERTGRDDVLCGVTVSGRPPELPDAERAVGSFVNNLPARLAVDRARRVDDWVRDVQRAQGRRQSCAHVSLGDILEWSDVPAAQPLFDLLVLLNLTDDSELAWPGIELVASAATLDAGYPLVLSVSTEGGQLVLTLVHDAAVGEAAALLERLDALVSRLALAAADATVGELLPAAAPRPPVMVTTAPLPTSRGLASGARSGEGGLAETLLHAWRDVLGLEDVGLDDDFFALGGTSLQAAQLFARIERVIGKSLPLSTLFEAGSVRALLAEVARPVPRSGSLVWIRSSGTRAPLFVVPGIGGNVVGLSGLARQLGPDQPFGAFESPGLDGREAPLTSIESIAERYSAEIGQAGDAPFHLLGICWGAAVAFEMARRLRGLGRTPLSLVLMDPAVLLRESAARPARAEATFLRNRLELYWDEFRGGDWRDRSRMLATKARRVATVLAGGESLERSQGELNQVRVREANKDAVTRYIPERYDGRAHIFLTADRDLGGGDDPRLEWRSLIDPPPTPASIGGVDSGDAISPAHVGGFASALREWLDTADTAP